MNIIRYEHHGRSMAVIEDHKGTHREHCLCYECANFAPGTEDNCPIAQSLFEFDVKNGVTTPVFECAEHVEFDH